MAYDPQDPLSSISGELAKRNKKNQTSRYEDRNKVGNKANPETTPSANNPSGLTLEQRQKIASDVMSDEQKRLAENAVMTQNVPKPGLGQVGFQPQSNTREYLSNQYQAPVNQQPKQGGYSVGYDFGKAYQNFKDLIGNIPGKVSQIPGEILAIPERAAAIKGFPMTYDINKMANNIAKVPGQVLTAIEDAPGQIAKTNYSVGYDFGKAQQNFKDLIGNLPNKIGQIPDELASIPERVSAILRPYVPGSSTQTGAKERGLTLQERRQTVADTIADEQKRLDANKETEAAKPAAPAAAAAPEPAPAQQAQAPAQPQPADARQTALDKARELRQQIAMEQQNMLTARRARGGMYGDAADAPALMKIRDLRNELNQYEQAGQSLPKVQTTEQYMQGAQQFADFATKEMQNQIQKAITEASYMPKGSPQREQAASRIRAMKDYMQQQYQVANAMQDNASANYADLEERAKAGVGRQEQMLNEQMRMRSADLARAQKLTGERELGEQRKKDIEAATQQAQLTAINAPGKMLEEQLKTGEASRNIARQETEAKVAKFKAEANLTEAQAKSVVENIETLKGGRALALKSAQLDVDAKEIANSIAKIRAEQLKEGVEYDPLMAEQKDKRIAQAMGKLGVSSQDEENVAAALTGLKQNITGSTGEKAYAISSDAVLDVERAGQINNYVRGLKSLYDQGGDAKILAVTKAKRLLNSIGGKISGQTISGGTALKTIGTWTASGAGIGAGAGAVGGAGAGAVPGAAFGGTLGFIGGTASAALKYLGTRTGLISDSDAEQIISRINESSDILQQMAQ